MMAVLLTLVVLCGMGAGFVLFRRVRFVPAAGDWRAASDVSIVIPARDEERNLPGLLASIRDAGLRDVEVIVVDDDSSDGTVSVAEQYGAVVVRSKPKPEHWRGKPWACWQGAEVAGGRLLLFVDADVRFAPDGLRRIRAMYGDAGGKALSVLPFAKSENVFEELSLFFNVLLAAGAGGFSGLTLKGLFGQSLLIDREMYFAVGGHGVVQEHVLENLYLAPFVREAGGEVETTLGCGALEMRMFPEGFAQLCASWRKGFASGAKATPVVALVLSVVWLVGMMTPIVALCVGVGWTAAVLYVLCAVQVGWMARRVGMYRWVTAMFYGVPLVFYFGLFAASWMKRDVVWKGRRV